MTTRTPTKTGTHFSPIRRVAACLLALSLAGTASAGSPLVSVSTPPGNITNDGQEAVYTLTLSAPSSKNIGVNFVMTGSALEGFDYTLIGRFNNTGQVVIPRGQTSVMITLHTFSVDSPLFQQIATLNILNGTRYHIGFPNNATVRIRNVP
jgi:hypothetical protein